MSELTKALTTNDLPVLIETLNAVFARLPYDYWKGNSESIFHATMHFAFDIIGVALRSEVHSAHGRADVIVETDTHVYVMEFKLDRPVSKALTQMRERAYAAGFAVDECTVVPLGISFSTELRGIEEWKVLDA